jgi:hypothetical protein
MADRMVQPTVAPGAETHEGVSLSRPLGRETPRQSASRQDGGETATETVDLKALARLVLARDARRDSNRDTVSRERRTTETQARQSSSKPVILKPAKTGETAPETPIALAVPSLSEIQSLTGVSLSRGLGVETTETGDTAWTAAEAEHTAIIEAQVLAPAPWFERHAPRGCRESRRTTNPVPLAAAGWSVKLLRISTSALSAGPGVVSATASSVIGRGSGIAVNTGQLVRHDDRLSRLRR